MFTLKGKKGEMSLLDPSICRVALLMSTDLNFKGFTGVK